jgi:hypothetical protein
MEVVLTFSGPAEAVKGEAALEAGGLAVKVMPRPPVLGAGCGLCLRLPEAEAAAGLRILAAAGLGPEGLYDRLEKDGTVSYRPRSQGF